MVSEFLIDLNDHENSWKGVSIGKTPDGRIAQRWA
jgi:hypothetical protein